MYRLYHRPNLLETTGLAQSLGQIPAFVRGALRKALHRVRRAWQEHIEIRSLERLDDRLLRDIGIPRADIPLVVKAALDAAEAKRASGQADTGPARVSLSDLGLRPCINC